MIEKDFRFDVEVDLFEKAGGGDKARRIGGFVSTADLDKQGEVVIQEGLDFTPFLKGGWFNDNHSRDMDGVLGFPEHAQLVKKGELLPSGKQADKTGWYVEGYLLKGVPKADAAWSLAQSLSATNRRLGFSIEGKVTKRETLAKGVPVVAAAVVKNVAITHCPVNDKTALEVLAKALSVGDGGGKVPAGEALTGAEGGGRVLMPESLDGVCPTCSCKMKDGKCAKCAQKSLKDKLVFSKAEALDLIKRRYRGITTKQARRVLAAALKKTA